MAISSENWSYNAGAKADVSVKTTVMVQGSFESQESQDVVRTLGMLK
jgi:hypothetical protein